MNEKFNFGSDRASRYNLDELISVFVDQNTPDKLHRELLALYFEVVNSFGRNGEVLGGFYSDALYTLQSIIEAVGKMTDSPETASYKIIEK